MKYAVMTFTPMKNAVYLDGQHGLHYLKYTDIAVLSALNLASSTSKPFPRHNLGIVNLQHHQIQTSTSPPTQDQSLSILNQLAKRSKIAPKILNFLSLNILRWMFIYFLQTSCSFNVINRL